MTQKFYRIIDHTADTGFEVRGDSKETIFEASALAFFDIMWKAEDRSVSKPEPCLIRGSDTMELMVNFLEEFLYLYDAKGLICTDLKVEKVTETTIHATAWLRHFNEKNDRELLGVKAVTYHQLFIGEKNGRWTARIFLDI
jgi:SHS2 domain-containing protein